MTCTSFVPVLLALLFGGGVGYLIGYNRNRPVSGGSSAGSLGGGSTGGQPPRKF